MPILSCSFIAVPPRYWLLAMAGHSPRGLCGLRRIDFFTWGEIFSLFPSTCADTFGPANATANISLLCTAKGTSAFLVPLANMLKSATGTWESVFLVAAVTNVVVILLALFVLRPIRANQMRRIRIVAMSRG
jgi:OFA family oxalate/formate antiporter-like MFS transporter